jgi:hypothetical protein
MNMFQLPTGIDRLSRLVLQTLIGGFLSTISVPVSAERVPSSRSDQIVQHSRNQFFSGFWDSESVPSMLCESMARSWFTTVSLITGSQTQRTLADKQAQELINFETFHDSFKVTFEV